MTSLIKFNGDADNASPSFNESFMYNFIEYTIYNIDNDKLSVYVIGDDMPKINDRVLYNSELYNITYVNSGKKIATLKRNKGV